MSNIGKLPINIPDGVNIDVGTDLVKVKGKNGELFMEYNSIISISSENNVLSVTRKSDDRKDKALHGLYRALLNNEKNKLSSNWLYGSYGSADNKISRTW